MSHFFFDLITNGSRVADPVGEDLVDTDEARDQAQAILAQMMRDRLPDGDSQIYVCEVRDEHDSIVYRGRLIFESEWVG